MKGESGTAFFTLHPSSFIHPRRRRSAGVLSQAELWSYLTVFAALVAAGLGFPLPEEIPIVTAGVLAGKTPDEPPPRPEEVVALLAATPGAGLGGVPWG